MQDSKRPKDPLFGKEEVETLVETGLSKEEGQEKGEEGERYTLERRSVQLPSLESKGLSVYRMRSIPNTMVEIPVSVDQKAMNIFKLYIASEVGKGGPRLGEHIDPAFRDEVVMGVIGAHYDGRITGVQALDELTLYYAKKEFLNKKMPEEEKRADGMLAMLRNRYARPI